MINLSFDLKDKKAARIFGQAMIDYSSDGQDQAAPPLQLVSEEVPVETLVELKEVTEKAVAAVREAADIPEPAAKIDENGVPFVARYCAKAKIPFYAAGKRKGQWKRRQGTDENEYDKWYASEHIKAQSGPATLVEPIAPDTAAAFGTPSQVMAPEPPAPVETVEDDTPQGAGELMKWISEQMNAGHLTQGDVDTGYSTAGVTPAELFAGDTDAIATLYNVLTAVIAA